MQTSVIRHRVADFLKQYPPFDALSEPDLLDLAGSGRVKFHESEEFVYWQGDPAGPFVWVIQQGRVDLLDGETLRDVLGAGDLVGLDRRTSARTATDVILYALDAAKFETLAGRFLVGRGYGRTSWLDAEPPPLDYLRAGSASVRLSGPLTVRSALREMIRAGVEVLAVEDKVVTAADLALFCGRDPIRLIAELRTNSSPALLRVARRLLFDALASPSDVDDYLLLKAALIPGPVPEGDLAAAIRDPILNDLYGNRALFDHIFDLDVTPSVIGILANDTMDRLPPMTFYEGAVLDLDGGRRTDLDLQASAIGPIVDAARVFALARKRLNPPGALERLASAAIDYPAHEAVFREAAGAYRVAVYYHTLAMPLSRYDQRQLKTAFVSIQRLLELTTATFLS